jgi:hypothetical protein
MICSDARARFDQLSGDGIRRNVPRERLDQVDDIEREPLCSFTQPLSS